MCVCNSFITYANKFPYIIRSYISISNQLPIIIGLAFSAIWLSDILIEEFMQFFGLMCSLKYIYWHSKNLKIFNCYWYIPLTFSLKEIIDLYILRFLIIAIEHVGAYYRSVINNNTLNIVLNIGTIYFIYL